MSSYRTWCKTLIVSMGTVISLTVATNYLVDPMWCFSHVTAFNRFSYLIDARQQKTNRITFDDTEYDAVIIGSSRADLISPDGLVGNRAFNYSISAITPAEYPCYLDYVKRKNRLNRIFLGLDFTSTGSMVGNATISPVQYFGKVNEKHYRFNMLFSLDVMKKLFKYRFVEKQICKYDREKNFVTPCSLSPEELAKIFRDRYDKIKIFYDSTYYVYNEKLRHIYQEIKSSNPDADIVVFITPESQALFEYAVRQGRMADFSRWLRDIVDVFGGVYNFGGLNSVTLNRANYIDADHFYPRIGTLMAHRLVGADDPDIPPDFGVYVTRDNLADHLHVLEKQAASVMLRQ